MSVAVFIIAYVYALCLWRVYVPSDELPPPTHPSSHANTNTNRDSLFQISGVRGNYPQLFVSVSSSPPTPPEFLGAWEKIEEMNELNDLPREVLEANPDIVTLDMVFGECEKVIEG